MRSGDLWTQQDKLTAVDGDAYDYFGGSVSISGGYAIIGAIALGEDDMDEDFGSAYIYTNKTNTPMPWIPLLLLRSDSN